jgi:hypothetical protein
MSSWVDKASLGDDAPVVGYPLEGSGMQSRKD